MNDVVIVDDSATARIFVQRCLEVAGIRDVRFHGAANGREALDRLRETGAELVVTDLHMPEMDGRELVRRIAASPRLHGTTVLVVTSNTSETVRDELLSLGATAVLDKPVNPAAVAEALASLIAGADDSDGWGAPPADDGAAW